MVIILVMMTVAALCMGSLMVRILTRASFGLKQRWHVERGYMKPRESSIY